MPIRGNEMKSIREYEKSVGASNDAPNGTHTIVLDTPKIMEGDDGRPALSALARIVGGDYDKRTFFVRMNWFTALIDRDGIEKDNLALERGNSFLRRLTIAVLTGVLGTVTSEWPDDFLMPEDGDDYEDVTACMESWITYLDGATLTCVVSDGNSGFQNFSYKAHVQEVEFALG